MICDDDIIEILRQSLDSDYRTEQILDGEIDAIIFSVDEFDKEVKRYYIEMGEVYNVN